MNRRALVTIFLIVLTDIIGFGIIIPLLPTISADLGISGLSLGFLTAAYAIAQFIASPILGFLSDKYGRKPILVFSKIGTVIAYLMLALSRNYYLIVLSRLIDGFTGGNIPAARAYISDITTKENRARGMAIIGMSFGLGFIIGPAIGGIFYSMFHSITAPALVGAAVSLISLVFTQLFLTENWIPQANHLAQKSGFFNIIKNPDIKSIFIIQLLVASLLSAYQMNLTFFSQKVFNATPEMNSIILVYIGILSLIIQGFLSQKKFTNPIKLMPLSISLTTLGLAVVAISPNYPIFLFALAINSLGSSLINVFIPTILSTISSTDPEGEIMGWYASLDSLGRIIGPAVIGSLILYQPRLSFLLLAILFPLSFISLKVFRIQKT